MAEQAKITALDNGPYLVKGPVLLLDAEGNEFRAERATVALCRCGDPRTSRSATAPIRRPVSERRRGQFDRKSWCHESGYPTGCPSEPPNPIRALRATGRREVDDYGYTS